MNGIDALLDVIATELFGMSRSDALAKGLCVRCQLPVAGRDWTGGDVAEWGRSALCPECLEAVFASATTTDESPD